MSPPTRASHGATGTSQPLAAPVASCRGEEASSVRSPTPRSPRRAPGRCVRTRPGRPDPGPRTRDRAARFDDKLVVLPGPADCRFYVVLAGCERPGASLTQDFERAFEQCDCLLAPTSPTPAFKIGEKVDDPLAMYLSDIYTVSVNLAGLPAISIPCGVDSQKLPIGAQIIGKPFDEETVLRAAHFVETNLKYLE